MPRLIHNLNLDHYYFDFVFSISIKFEGVIWFLLNFTSTLFFSAFLACKLSSNEISINKWQFNEEEKGGTFQVDYMLIQRAPQAIGQQKYLLFVHHFGFMFLLCIISIHNNIPRNRSCTSIVRNGSTEERADNLYFLML